MSNHTYRTTEIVGTSPESLEQAIRNGLERVARSIHHIDWFEATQIRGMVSGDGQIEHFQVGLKVSSRIED